MPAAGRLAREVAPFIRGSVRACGRLCLIADPDLESVVAAVRYLAPLVIDVDTRTEGAAAAAVADHVVLVGSPSTEPALAALLGQTLGALGPEPVKVLNRAGPDGERWTGRAELELPDSRMGARVALAGREPRGVLGRAVSELTARCGSAC